MSPKIVEKSKKNEYLQKQALIFINIKKSPQFLTKPLDSMFPFSHLDPFSLHRQLLWDLAYPYSRLLQQNLNLKTETILRNLAIALERRPVEIVKTQHVEKSQTSDSSEKKLQNIQCKVQEFDQSQHEQQEYSQKCQKNNQNFKKTKQINQTKNISKNFGKAILTFTKNNPKLCQTILKKHQVDKQDLIVYIKKVKKSLNSLQDLRDMWGAQDGNDRLKKCLRIISFHFMRKRCLFYIYNSRIRSTQAHIKYRYRLMEGMKNPAQFFNIKEN